MPSGVLALHLLLSRYLTDHSYSSHMEKISLGFSPVLRTRLEKRVEVNISQQVFTKSYMQTNSQARGSYEPKLW